MTNDGQQRNTTDVVGPKEINKAPELPSIGDCANSSTISQRLIDYLVKTGEIEDISNHQLPSSDRKRCLKNDTVQYQELVGAFNVILKEILRRGKFDTSYELSANDSDLANQNNISSDKKSPKNGSRMCPIEKELLRQVAILHKKLIAKSGEQKKKFRVQRSNTNSSQEETIDDENCYDDKTSIQHASDVMVEMQSNSQPDSSLLRLVPLRDESVNLEDSFQMPKLDIRIGGASIGKREANNSTVDGSNLLTKENNFGMEVQKFIKLAERLEQFVSSTIVPPTDEIQASTNSNNRSVGVAIASGGIKIPLRLVQRCNGFYLQLDGRQTRRRTKKRT